MYVDIYIVTHCMCMLPELRVRGGYNLTSFAKQQRRRKKTKERETLLRCYKVPSPLSPLSPI